MDQGRIDGSAWIAWRLLFGRGPWCQGRLRRRVAGTLDTMVRVQNLVAHAIQALPQVSGVKTQGSESVPRDSFWTLFDAVAKHALAIILLFVSLGYASADPLSATAEGAISAYRREHGLPAVKIDAKLMQL